MQSRMIQAIESRNLAAIDAILAEGLDVNALDSDGRTPLMHAVLGSGSDPKLLRALLDRGADPNVRDRLLGWSALHYAVRDQKLEMVATLLERGANPNEEDVFGDTPLWRCVTDSSPSARIMRLLIDKGADPAKPHMMGISVLELAMSLENGAVVAALCA